MTEKKIPDPDKRLEQVKGRAEEVKSKVRAAAKDAVAEHRENLPSPTEIRSKRKRLSRAHHMAIPWHDTIDEASMENEEAAAALSEEPDSPEEACQNCCAVQATLKDKTTFIGRIGIMFLSVGTGAWRVRESLNTVSRALGVTSSADIGLMSLELTCFYENESYTETFNLHTSGVNTDKLKALEAFVREFPGEVENYTIDEFHQQLDKIKNIPGNYKPWNVGLASAIACCAFTFLLGGGIPEMICAFFGAGAGNWLRRRMLDRKIALIGCIIASVAFACAVYVGCITFAEHALHVSSLHEVGYICSMLFIIPGFPLITGGIDLAKLDMRSGLERLAYALFIITVATLTGWVTALILRFEPGDFVPLSLGPVEYCLLRLVASFFGVYGFSLMFNSPRKMAALAGLIGMIANTLRLELVDLAHLPVGIAAFIGAFVAGLMAWFAKQKAGYPRISLTVPSIVIMVPGLFMYRGLYYLGMTNISDGAQWLIKAILMVIALPLGLVLAQVITDKEFRHCS